MTFHYKINVPLATPDILRVYNGSGIKRPTHDVPRIEKMFAQANLIASAWDDDKLIGIARALTDHSYCCYLSDLACGLVDGDVVDDDMEVELNQAELVVDVVPCR